MLWQIWIEMRTRMLFLASVCFFSFTFGSSSEYKQSLNVLGLFPYRNSGGWPRGDVLIPAAQIAVDDVNKDPSILPDYNLTMIVKNGGCDEQTVVATSLGKTLLSENFVGIVGAPCSRSSITTSNIAGNAGINQISYGAELAELSDTTRYPYFFRTTVSLAHVADGFAALLDSLHRHSVIIVAQTGTWHSVASFSSVKFVVFEHPITVERLVLLDINETDDMIDGKLEIIRKSRKHIIVTFLLPESANALMCRVYRMKMTYPKFLWIHHLTTGEWTWWLQYSPKLSCNVDEMLKAHRGSMMHGLQLFTKNDTRLDIFASEYRRRLGAHLIALNTSDLTTTYSCLQNYTGENGGNSIDNATDESLECLNFLLLQTYALTAYDSVWVIARALHNVAVELKQKYNQTLADFQRGTNHFSKLIHDSLSDTDFHGLSGYIKYQRGGNHSLDKNTRAVRSLFYQITDQDDDVLLLVAMYDGFKSPGNEFNFNESLTAINQSIPVDDALDYPLLFYPQLGAVTLALNIIFLLTMTPLLILNNLYSQHQPFKGSDSMLTNFQIGAVYLLTVGSLITSVFSCVDIDNATAFGVAVNSSTWMTDVGLIFFLAIAAAKSYRLYSIFVNYLQSRKFLNHGYYLMVFAFLVMAGIVLYEFVIIIIYPFLRSPERRCEISDGEITHCYYYSVDPRYTNFIVIVVAAVMNVFLFMLGVKGWAIKDPRFYDIHNNAMLSFGLLLYCIVAVVAIPVLPYISWPFLHGLSVSIFCGVSLQVFFVFPFLWKLYAFHRVSAKVKCHCIQNQLDEALLSGSTRRISIFDAPY